MYTQKTVAHTHIHSRTDDVVVVVVAVNQRDTRFNANAKRERATFIEINFFAK